MKKTINTIFFGKDRFSGILALTIVALIALGCTCGKNFDLGNLDKPNNSASNSASNTASNTASNSASNTASTPRTTSDKADASTGKLPTDEQLQNLARTTILDFNDAIQKEDFTDFRETVSKPFQKQASAEKFKEGFKDFITARVNFREVQDLDATFSETPKVGRQSGYKTLEIKGVYDTSPRNTKFELQYIAEGSDWKLIMIRVSTKDE